MAKEYIEQRDGGYWIGDTRISLDSVVYAFQRGAAPEAIVRSFPLLTLEQVYGAIAYYLAHEQAIDAYVRQGEAEFDALRQASREELRRTKPELFDRLEAARKQRETGAPGIPGPRLLAMLDTLPPLDPEVFDDMEQVIEEDCERIDPREW